jgi:hypothetical protein
VKFSQAMATAILIGGLLTGPAVAGVTGAEGGSGSVTENRTETINETHNVHRVDTYQRHDTSSRTDNYVTNTFNKRVYEYDTQTRWAPSKTVRTSSSETLEWHGVKHGGWDAQRNPEAGRTVSYSSETSHSSGVETVDSYDKTTFLGTSTAVDKQTTVRPVTTYLGRDTSFVKRDTVKTRETSVESDRTRTDSTDAIVIGDADALQGAYVAQGQVSQHTNIHTTHDDTYDHTDTYLNVDNYHTTNNYTHTTNITHTDKYRKTEITTKRHVDYYHTHTVKRISPIVLDLDGDGKLQASNGQWEPHEGFDRTRVALFDFHANGFPVLTEWVGPNDGLLVRPNEDGSVDGSCLFGSTRGFAHGYDAMAALDFDNNGKLEGTELAGLMIWQDKNSNAVVDDGELLTLEELGITSIGVSHDNLKGSYTRNGQTFNSYDWWPTTMEIRKKNMEQAI